ncbi:cytochrome c-type biogenesis protein [Pontivivens insulae]|uniref:Cytochrome c-type biogenesis protein n=1 Tax=Pontivivens insulae TaxID=1639689 RepID=A0A2R8ABJ6_9RHOB|nr:cytochrome c-type biogenesis protein [Pontivivens insulae]RED11233.1 cytochrome c-type biogenesis protein CcmH [Pontivivens insulae]SPF29594.1 Cytochrome c-type biogenesis protein CcmH [Pontivivens insulae]
MKRLILILCLMASPLFAVTPDEQLDDPVLEERARALSQELRCLVCRNENIDASNAELAQDLRVLVRERLVEGDTDEQVLAYVVDRYGEYVLLRPTLNGANLILWLTAPVLLLLGLAIAVVKLRQRPKAVAPLPDDLSEAERARLDRLIKE